MNSVTYLPLKGAQFPQYQLFGHVGLLFGINPRNSSGLDKMELSVSLPRVQRFEEDSLGLIGQLAVCQGPRHLLFLSSTMPSMELSIWGPVFWKRKKT